MVGSFEFVKIGNLLCDFCSMETCSLDFLGFVQSLLIVLHHLSGVWSFSIIQSLTAVPISVWPADLPVREISMHSLQ